MRDGNLFLYAIVLSPSHPSAAAAPGFLSDTESLTDSNPLSGEVEGFLKQGNTTTNTEVPEPAAVLLRRALVIDPHPEAAAGLGQRVAALGFDTGIMAIRDMPLLLREDQDELLPDVALVRLNRSTAGAVAEFLRSLRNLPSARQSRCLVLAVTDVNEPVGRMEAWLARGVDDFLTDPLRIADEETLGARLAVAESRLRQREANARTAAAEAARWLSLEHTFQESAAGLIVLHGPEARVLEVNATAGRLLGFSPEDLSQQPLALLLPHLLEAAHWETGEPSGSGGGLLAEECPNPIRHFRPDGSTVFLEASLTPLPCWAWEKEAVLLTLHDCTARRLRDDRRLHDARQETASQVLSGTARHLGDTLTAIRCNLELLLHQPGPRLQNTGAAPRDDFAHQAREACDRAVAFSKRLTLLARLSQGGQLRRCAVDLRALLETTVPFTLLNRQARPVLAADPGLWPVEADEAALTELLRCLTVNADEAMPAGGNLYFTAENVPASASGPGSGGVPAQVRLTIRDEGHGVRPADLPALFDPWFTTKPGREGMGLAVVAGIVKGHQGRITVESDGGSGTTFTLWLPAFPPPLSGSGSAENLTGEADGTFPPFSSTPAATLQRPPKIKILLMDDDGGVRLVMERILSRAGYEVYSTRDGQEAVEACRKAAELGSPFDLLLVDLDVRDGMGGLECVACLRSEFPGLRALLTTGCLDHPIMETWPDHGLLGVIPKPFQIDAFLRSLEQLAAKPR